MWKDTLMGTIIPWALDFEPEGWKFCHGQLLERRRYQALSSLLGTKYGGDGIVYFALPDLRGCMPMGMGVNPFTKSNRGLGSRHDSPSHVRVLTSNLPTHNHKILVRATVTNSSGIAAPEVCPVTYSIPASSSNTGTSVDTSSTPSATSRLGRSSARIYTTHTPDVDLEGGTVTLEVPQATIDISGVVASVGAGDPIDVTPPYLALSYIIAVEGIYPPKQFN
ncbi:MAG: tail fiber protein [Magnetococcales bacterium]|nr:tail fiber protein [Magnetococcales bacterium]